MKVVAFGDSVTYGEHVPRDKTWPALLGYENKGVCADTTRLALERFPKDVQQSGAEVVLIQFGYNDCNRWNTDRGMPRVSLRAFEANLTEMIRRALCFQIRPVLVGMYPTGKDNGYETIRTAYQHAIRRISNAQKIRLIDPEWQIKPEHLLDELHLNEQGHKVFKGLARV